MCSDEEHAMAIECGVPAHLWSSTPHGALHAAVRAQPACSPWLTLLRRACAYASAVQHDTHADTVDSASAGAAVAAVVAGVVLSVARTCDTVTLRQYVCVSLGSGTRCSGVVPRASSAEQRHDSSHQDDVLGPLVLRDGHAEVMARRGFVAFLLDAVATMTTARTCSIADGACGAAGTATAAQADEQGRHTCRACDGGSAFSSCTCRVLHPFVEQYSGCAHCGGATPSYARPATRRGDRVDGAGGAAVAHTVGAAADTVPCRCACAVHVRRWGLRCGVRVHLVCTHWPCGALACAVLRQPSGRVLLRTPRLCTRCAPASASSRTASAQVVRQRQPRSGQQEPSTRSCKAADGCDADDANMLCQCRRCGNGAGNKHTPHTHALGHTLAAHHSAIDTCASCVACARVKPGKGHPNLNMSCTDKLWRWGQLGIQGRRRARLLSWRTMHLYSVHVGVVAADADVCARSPVMAGDEGCPCRDAACQRLASAAATAQHVYDVRAHALPATAYATPPPLVATTTTVSACASSHVLPLIVPFMLSELVEVARSGGVTTATRHDGDDADKKHADDDSCYSRAVWVATATLTPCDTAARRTAACDKKRPRGSGGDDEKDAARTRAALSSHAASWCSCLQWSGNTDTCASSALVLNTKHGLPRGVTVAGALRIARTHMPRDSDTASVSLRALWPLPPSPPSSSSAHLSSLSRLLATATRLTRNFPLSRAWMAVRVLQLVASAQDAPWRSLSSSVVPSLCACATLVRVHDAIDDALRRGGGMPARDGVDYVAEGSCSHEDVVCARGGCMHALLHDTCMWHTDKKGDASTCVADATQLQRHVLWVHK